MLCKHYPPISFVFAVAVLYLCMRVVANLCAWQKIHQDRFRIQNKGFALKRIISQYQASPVKFTLLLSLLLFFFGSVHRLLHFFRVCYPLCVCTCALNYKTSKTKEEKKTHLCWSSLSSHRSFCIIFACHTGKQQIFYTFHFFISTINFLFFSLKTPTFLFYIIFTVPISWCESFSIFKIKTVSFPGNLFSVEIQLFIYFTFVSSLKKQRFYHFSWKFPQFRQRKFNLWNYYRIIYA